MRKPRKWCLSLTYEPKVQAVREGRCTQSIRAGWTKQVGDQVAFHGWEGVPRHSRWSWRTGYFPLVEVIDILVGEKGLLLWSIPGLVRLRSPFPPPQGWVLFHWNHFLVKRIAKRDFVDPPTGEELGRILLSMHKIGKLNGSPFQILRWRP